MLAWSSVGGAVVVEVVGVVVNVLVENYVVGVVDVAAAVADDVVVIVVDVVCGCLLLVSNGDYVFCGVCCSCSIGAGYYCAMLCG